VRFRSRTISSDEFQIIGIEESIWESSLQTCGCHAMRYLLQVPKCKVSPLLFAKGGTCVTTRCAVSLDACPTDENDVGDLRVSKNGRVVQCLAPCKKWNYPPPFGLGQPESDEPGLSLCCPTPPITRKHNKSCSISPVFGAL
jgi:hypothetical protein